MKKYIIAIILSTLLLTGCSDSEPSDRAKKISACTYAQIEVKDMLKNPSSADFSPCSLGDVTVKSENKYRVTGKVTAENSFGGNIKESYECNVTLTSSDEYYINCSMH